MKTNALAPVRKTGGLAVGLAQANGNIWDEYLWETCGMSAGNRRRSVLYRVVMPI